MGVVGLEGVVTDDGVDELVAGGIDGGVAQEGVEGDGVEIGNLHGGGVDEGVHVLLLDGAIPLELTNRIERLFGKENHLVVEAHGIGADDRNA